MAVLRGNIYIYDTRPRNNDLQYKRTSNWPGVYIALTGLLAYVKLQLFAGNRLEGGGITVLDCVTRYMRKEKA